MAKAYRYKRNLSCMRLNFDNFDDLTSGFGSDLTDMILKEGSNVIRKTLRKSDVIGRVKDSELGILFPETNISNAEAAGKKLRDVITKTEFSTEAGTINITMSIGISSNASQKDETDSTFDKAEKALKEAKLIGPDSLVINP